MRDASNITILAATLAARGMVPHHAAALAEELAAIGRSASRAATDACNTPHGYEALEKRTARNRKRAESVMARYRGEGFATATVKAMRGLSVKIGGDPRGYCLHIVGLPGNSWGGDSEGFGI